MRARQLDALLLTDPAAIYYLTGSDSQSVTHLQCLVLPPEGDATLFTWDFEAGNVAVTSWVPSVVTYSWFEDPVKRFVELLRALRLEDGRMALDLRSRYLAAATVAALQEALPEAEIEDAFGIVEECRARKSPAELAYMRRAAELTDDSIAVAYSAARVGARDTDVAAAVMEFLYAAGSEALCSGPIVASGFAAGLGHASFTGRTLAAGDTLFLEYSAQVRRYVAPVMRTAVLGRASPEMALFRDAGMAAIDSVLAEARPGVPAGQVARAALECLAPVRGKTHFHGLVAYSVGLGFPTTRYESLGYELREGNEKLLAEGMAFHVVMSLRKFGEFGVSQSHTVVITADGAEAITKSPAALAEI
jgi:Xaa-Pro aminopeptidase